jgi:putative membrane protein
MVVYDKTYSKFFLGVPGILLLIGGIGTVVGYTAEIFAVLVSILGGAFLIRAFDIDKSWSNWTKATPTGFIRIFALITGVVLILASIPAGVTNVDPQLFETEMDFGQLISNQIVLGQFLQGLFPFF